MRRSEEGEDISMAISLSIKIIPLVSLGLIEIGTDISLCLVTFVFSLSQFL